MRIRLCNQQFAFLKPHKLLFSFSLSCVCSGQCTMVLSRVSHDTKDANWPPERMTQGVHPQNLPLTLLVSAGFTVLEIWWNRNDFVWSKEIPVRWSVLIQNSPLKQLSASVSYCRPPLMYLLESWLKPYQQSSRGCRYSIALCAVCHVGLQVSALITYSVTAEWIVFSFCHVWVLCEIPFISEWRLTAFHPWLTGTGEVRENTYSPTFKPNFKHVSEVIVCSSFIILYWLRRRQQLDDAVIWKRGTKALA